jgi:hypothetical protein
LDQVSVAWRDRPFGGAFHQHVVPFEGRPPTVAAILESVPDLPEDLRVVGEVRLDGELLPHDRLDRVRPRMHRGRCITLHMPLEHGGGGGSGQARKNPLATVATIAVLLAAAAVSGGVLGPAGVGLLGASFAGVSLGAAVLGAATGCGGELRVWS